MPGTLSKHFICINSCNPYKQLYEVGPIIISTLQMRRRLEAERHYISNTGHIVSGGAGI